MATLTELLDKVSALLGRRDLSLGEFQNWLAGPANGGPAGDGLFPLTDSTGFQRLLPGPAKVASLAATGSADCLYPDQFDAAAGSGPTHDDAPAIKAMLAQSLVDGRLPALRPGKRYYLGSTVTIDPSRQGLRGNAAVLDFRLKSFVDPANVPELLSDPDFDSGVPWITSANTTLAPTFAGGDLVFQPAAGTYQYLEIGQQITCAANQALTVVVTVDQIDTVTSGPNTFRSALLSLRAASGSAANSIGSGAPVGGIGTISNTDSIYTTAKAAGAAAVYTFTVTPTSANPYLRIQTSAGLRLGKVSIKIVPSNACLLIRTPPEGQLRGHNYREIEGFKIAGRADQAALVDGILLDTLVPGWSSRCRLRNLDVSDGIGRCLVFGNRAYLEVIDNCRMVASVACIDTLTGSIDAGENIAIVGGNLGGGNIGIRNLGGFAFRLFGTSIDFSRQWITGGNVKMFGGWLETNAPTVAGYPLIDASAGDVILRGTRVQVDGARTAVLDTPFAVGAGCILDIEAEVPSNLASVSGALCSGAGRFIWRGVGGANKEIPAITKRDAAHNLLGTGGSFEDPTITFPVWLQAAAGQQQVDRYTIGLAPTASFTGNVAQGERAVTGTSMSPTSAYAQAAITSTDALPGTRIAGYQNAGGFTATTAVGSNVLTAVSPAPTASTANNLYVSGPGIPVGARVIGYSNGGATLTLDRGCSATATGVSISTSNIVILSQPWNGPSATGATIGATLASTARAAVELSTEAFRSGTRSLKFYKTGAGPTAWQSYIAVPIVPGRAVGMEWWYMVPAGIGTGTTAVYFQTFFAHLSGMGGSAVPAVGQTLFVSDLPQSNIDLAAGRTWTQVTSSTNRVDASSLHDGYAPEWANHFLVVMNGASVPNNFALFIDDIHADLM